MAAFITMSAAEQRLEIEQTLVDSGLPVERAAAIADHCFPLLFGYAVAAAHAGQLLDPQYGSRH